jgi:hypothetical protein
MASLVKICHICAVDVSQKKRTKDAQGRYYCEACYKAQRARAAGQAPAEAAEPPEKPRGIPLDDEEGVIELADDVKKTREPAKPEAMFGCADCKRIVPEKQIRNDDGDFVCLACFSKRREKAPTAMPKKKLWAETEQPDDENRETWKDTLAGGAIISACVLALAFGVYLLLYLYMQPLRKGEEPLGIGYASVVAGIRTVFTVFQAAALMVSMVFAGRLLGGIEFGYIGSALWKSLMLVLGFSVLSFFSDRYEAIWMLSQGFQWGLLILAFVVLFRIDFFEAMILSFVNTAIFFVLAFGMAGLMLSVNRSFRGDVDDQPAPMIQNRAAPNPGDVGL